MKLYSMKQSILMLKLIEVETGLLTIQCKWKENVMPNKNSNKYPIKSLSSTLCKTDKFLAKVILCLTGHLFIQFKYWIPGDYYPKNLIQLGFYLSICLLCAMTFTISDQVRICQWWNIGTFWVSWKNWETEWALLFFSLGASSRTDPQEWR